MENPTPLPNQKKRKHSIVFPLVGKTKQSMKDECDINKIMSKYQTTGLIDFVNKNQPQYGDVTSISFEHSLEQVTQANAMFAEMPSETRKRFDNSASKFLEFVNNPENLEEAISLGLINSPDRRAAEPRAERTRASDAPPSAPAKEPEVPPATPPS